MEEGGAEGERVPLRTESASDAAGSFVPGGGGEREVGIEQGDLMYPPWMTVDGPMGVPRQDASKLARNYFRGGFCLLPWLWFVNCFYFFPVLREPHLDPLTRPYIVWSAIGCFALTVVVLGWGIAFACGGERVFGYSWNLLAVYDIADKYSMAWSQ